MKISLNGEWRFREKGKNEWMQATVPGCNYLDLLKLNKIKDPFVGMNENDAYWVALTDWEYERDFDVDESMLDSDEIVLSCDMLDTICDVYVNEKLVGKGNNCHKRFEQNVSNVLQKGKNKIRIVFYSPVKYVEKKQAQEKCPPNCNGQDGIPHIRKPQCHFGWDWGPVLPPSGISGDISLVARNGAYVSDMLITQHHENGNVDLNIAVETQTISEKYSSYCLSLYDPNGNVIMQESATASQKIDKNVCIEKPVLWWTHELNPVDEQPLYTVKAELKNSDGEILDSCEKKIGLRTLTLDTQRDEWGTNFRFILNGKAIFVKGANWIPADSFINRYTHERLEYDLKAALFSNMNMLRIWGGGYYESDDMYDMCDRYGILLWQDFLFACQAYPFFDDAFTENVKSEVEYNVKRLRHHASLAIWSGNNEIEAMSAGWITRRKYIEWTEKFFYHILPEHVRKFDCVTPYIPGSPCGIDHMNGHDRDNVGDTHLWAVWHGLQPMKYYRKRLTRFCSEFGFESLPDIKTIKKFAKPEDYSLTSDVFMSHQKCKSGNMKMAYYIASRFRLPKNFEDYIYLSQICQQECVKDATEHWRRNKGRCNGSMYWQLNDCWPVCSWASMDYYGNYKALQYTSRHFNAPVSVSIQDDENDIKIYAINDTLKNEDCELCFAAYDFNGREYLKKRKKLVLQAEKVFVADIINRKDIKAKEYVLVADLYRNDVLINRKTYLPKAEKDMHFPKANCTLRTEIKENTAYIHLKSDKFMRLVRVESAINTLPMSDNFMDLLPNEEICITQQIPQDMDKEKYISTLSVMCVSDVEAKSSRLSDNLTRLKIFLEPANFGSYLYNRKIPKDAVIK